MKNEDGSWSRLERFETNFVDLSGDGGLLGQAAGRTGAAVVGWLDARGEQWKAAVRVVAMDPSAGYRAAVKRALPHARVVVDHFHLVRPANQVVTEVRQRAIREAHRRRGRRVGSAWTHRHLRRPGRRRVPRRPGHLPESCVFKPNLRLEWSLGDSGQVTKESVACLPGPCS